MYRLTNLLWPTGTAAVSLCSMLVLAFTTAAGAGIQDATTAPSVRDGIYTSMQADRGEQTFNRICTACHKASELTGVGFSAKWADQTMGDLFGFVSTAMPQGDPGSLTGDEYASIVAFFLRQSGYAAGQQELIADKDALSKITIVPPSR